MPTKKRNEHSQDEKRIAFGGMAKTYNACLQAKNFVAAHVIAFSFLEDRVAAMDIVLGRSKNVDHSKYLPFAKRVARLETAADLSTELAVRFRSAAKRRNELLHAAMWNLSVFSAEGANEVLELARKADAARKRQKMRLKQ